MTHADFATALSPKVAGSWNLHTLLPSTLDFFLLLSSGSGIVGNSGQANYSAGNTYQDALARYRTTHGLKATTLDLGMILSVGFIAEKPEVMARLKTQGYAAIREEEFLAILDELCDPRSKVSTLLKSQIVLGLELPETLRTKGIDEPAWMQDPMFKHIHQIRSTNKDSANTNLTDSINYKTLFASLETLQSAEEACTTAIVTKLSKVLGIDVKSIDATQALHVYGVDSLVAVELRAWLLKELAAEVAVFDIIGEGSIKVLGALVARKSTLVQVSEGDE
jgi:hypothetical protein